MTRWARAKSVYQHCKQPEKATEWSEYFIHKTEEKKDINDDKTDKINSNITKISSIKTTNHITKKKKKLKLSKKNISKKCREIKNNEIQENELNEPDSKLKNKTKIKKKLKKLKNIKLKDSLNNSTTFSTDCVEDKDLTKDVNQKSENSSSVKELNESERLHKKSKSQQLKEFRKLKRQQNGILLLPEKIENKIYRLKSTLRKKGIPGDKIKEIVRKERRKAEIKYKKENKQVCFHCRQPGHQIAKCPSLLNDIEQGVDICFKCGSTEHKIKDCSAKINDFPFAKCFICKEQGHISRNCPKNEKGLYPYGGCCNHCGKIDHLKKDCPELKEIEDVPELLLPTMKITVSADAEIDEYFQERRSKPKVINF